MRYWMPVAMVLLSACGGSLSDEQRRQMREQMELREIKKVTEVQITEAAFARGREITKLLEAFQGDSTRIDSLVNAENGRIKWIVPQGPTAVALEQQLLDAYVAAETGSLKDNVQLVRNDKKQSDSILYTKPVVTEMPDSTEKLKGVWNIWLSKKQLILSMD